MKRSSHRRPSEVEAIDATAAAWLAERDHGFTPAQEVEFAQWRADDVRHEAAVTRLETTWAALQQLRDFRPEARVHPDRDLLRSPPSRRRVVSFPALAAAIALAASLAVATVWWVRSNHRDAASREQLYATTVDGYERVSLVDGSSIELNSASEVSVSFSSAERRVRLRRGEAHFTVAKDKARPFMVEAGLVAVRAVGTAFNVRLGGKEVEVLVTEGRVAVAASTTGSQSSEFVSQMVASKAGAAGRSDVGGQTSEVGPGSAVSNAGRMSTELGANERLVIPVVPPAVVAGVAVPPVIEKVTPDIVREVLAWQGPRLVFMDTPLAEAIAQFNRRNPVQLELAEAELGALPIGGSFRAENVDAFVRLLASGGEIAVERPDVNRIILRRSK